MKWKCFGGRAGKDCRLRIWKPELPRRSPDDPDDDDEEEGAAQKQGKRDEGMGAAATV